jgi:hypothetical protein
LLFLKARVPGKRLMPFDARLKKEIDTMARAAFK